MYEFWDSKSLYRWENIHEIPGGDARYEKVKFWEMWSNFVRIAFLLYTHGFVDKPRRDEETDGFGCQI